MYLPIYRCYNCEWEGKDPSISDASEVVDGVMQRTHVLLCPRCFKTARSIS